MGFLAKRLVSVGLVVIGMLFGARPPVMQAQPLGEELYLPAVVNQFRVFVISGRILLDGVATPGVGVQLTRINFCGNPADVVIASTMSAADGSYRFANMAALSGQDVFCVRYVNPSTTDDSRLGRAYSEAIFSFDSAGQALVDDLEISNIDYIFPSNNDRRTLPLDFVWTRRASSTSDSYRLQILEVSDQSVAQQSPALGYVGQITLTGLAANVNVGTPYLWRIIAELPGGALAIPFYSYRITFGSRSLVSEVEQVPSNLMAAP